MEVSYETTKDDALAVIPYVWKNSPTVQKNLKRVRLFYLIIGTACLMAAVGVWLLDEPEYAIIVAIVAVLMYIYPWFFKWLMRRAATRSAAKLYDRTPSKFITRHDLSITGEGIKDSTAMGETFTRWPVISGIADTGRYLFLMSTGGVIAIVPERVFPGQTEFQQFAAEIKSLFQASQNT